MTTASAEDHSWSERGELADILIAMRRSVRLSQRGLAKLAGVSQGTIRDLETGKQRRPHFDTLRLLARGMATREDAGLDQDLAGDLYHRLAMTVDEDPPPSPDGSATSDPWPRHYSSRFSLTLDADVRRQDEEADEANRLTSIILEAIYDDRTPIADRRLILGILRTVADRFPVLPDEPRLDLPSCEADVEDDETAGG